MNSLVTFFTSRTWLVKLILVFAVIGMGDYYFTNVGRVVSTVTDENIFAGQDSIVTVVSVVSGGASDRAGMKVGDEIFSINGKRFKGALEADKILRESNAGSVMVYEIYRNGQKKTLFVQAATIGVSIRIIASSVVFLAMLGLALFVGWKAPNQPAAWHFSVTFILLSLLVSAGFSIDRAGMQIFGQFLFIIAIPLLLHLSKLFPFQSPDFSLVKPKLKLLYSTALFFLGLIFILSKIPGTPELRGIINSVIIALSVIYIIFLIVFGTLFFKTKHEDKKIANVVMTLWIIYGSIIFSSTLLSIFINQAFSILLFLVLIVPLGYFYLIIKYRAFGITRVVKRNVQYYLLTASVIFGLIILFFSIMNQITALNLGDAAFRFSPTAFEIKMGGTNDPGFSERPFFILAGIVVFIGIFLFGRFIQRRLARLFFKDDINYRQAMVELSEVMASKLNLTDLGGAICEELVQHLKLKSAVLYIRSSHGFQLIGMDGILVLPDLDLNYGQVRKELEALQAPVPSEKLMIGPDLKSVDIQFVAPLLLKNKMIGMVFLGGKRSDDMFNLADVQFIESLSRQIAVAVENTRLSQETLENEMLKRDLDLASKIQRNLLPVCIPAIQNLDICGTYVPASQVGGDYYDFLTEVEKNPESSVTIILGDVAGKGVSAALMVARVQGIMNSAFRQANLSLKNLLVHANLLTTFEDRKNFITLVAGRFNPVEKTVSLCRAGHLPILHYDSAKKMVSLLTPKGIALGMSRNGKFSGSLDEVTYKLHSGDIWIFFSDGISEAMNELNEEFDVSRIVTEIKNGHHLSASELSDQIFKSLGDFLGEKKPHDDTTLVVVKVGGNQ